MRVPVLHLFTALMPHTYFLYSESNLRMSSFESLLLSCLYKGENLPFRSKEPWTSLKMGLKTATHRVLKKNYKVPIKLALVGI